MIFNDAIHVEAKGGGDSNVEGINTLEIDDCLCVVHDVWWRVKLVPTMYKQPQLIQGTRTCYW